MAFEFIDEVETKSPEQASSGVGFEFIDEPSEQGGVEFLDETRPPSDDEIIDRVSNPTYKPSLAEFKLFKDAKERRPFSVTRVISKAGQAAGVVLSDLAKLGKEVVTLEQWRNPLDTAQSVVEGAGRALYDYGLLARRFNASANPAGGSFYSEDQYVQYKLARTNQEAFPQGGATQAIKLTDVPQETLGQWKKEFKDLRDESDYQRFIQEREYQQPRIQATMGEQPLVPEVIGKVNPEIAEGMSYIADPTLLMPGGMAAKGPGLTEKALAATAAATGKTIEKTGRAVTAVARIPETVASKVTKVVTESEDAAAKAAERVNTGLLGQTIGVGKVAGKTIETVGQATEAVGRALPAANERFGLFANIAKDADAPGWLRASAGRLTKLDPALASTGAVIKGGAQGATIGATIGGVTEGEEGFSAGLGSGGALGATGAATGRLLSSKSRTAAAEDADIDAWFSSKTPDEIANIRSTNLTREDALKMADMERLARGIVGKDTPGDVEFHYLKGDEFEKRFGPAKGAQVVEGDRPAVYANTGWKGETSLFHEVSHALDTFNEFSPQRIALNRLLFDQVSSDGAVISKGLYSLDDMAKFEEQYKAKLSPEQKAEWDILQPDQRQKAVMGEVRADHFRNLVKGSEGGMFADLSSLKGKMLDSMLLAESSSMLGKIRGALEKVGVKFDQSGAPSELFVKDGKPLTNSPEVNAALRDYLRAKDNITKRLIASDDETPNFTISREELAKGNKGAIEVLKDSDVFARNPDGSIKTVGGNPEKIKALESKVSQLEKDARAALDAATESQKKALDAEQAVRVAEQARRTAEEALATARSKTRIAELKAEILKAREARKIAQALQKEAKANEKAAKEQKAATEAARKELAAEEKVSGGTPVLLTDAEINKLQTKRVEMIMDALKKIPDKGEVGAVKIDPNVKDLAFTGRYFNDEQMAAINALPDNVLAPSIKAKIESLNNTLKADDGTQLILDYNAALRGKKYSSGISVSTRSAVPLSINISKAGNFYLVTLDTSHFYRKLQDWKKSKPKVFEPWEGDVDLFIRDTFKYLDNHANGRPGKAGLAPDDKTATLKRDTINDFFNVPGHRDVNPIEISTKSEKDNLIRARRLDRINRIQESEGDKFPIDYGALKQNLLPAD